MPDEVLARIGDVPVDPFERARWAQRVLAEVMLLTARGEIDKGLAESLRATASAAQRAFPMDLMLEVERVARADRDTVNADDHGPQLEEVRDAQPQPAVRANPR